jgi:hypothetical protein
LWGDVDPAVKAAAHCFFPQRCAIRFTVRRVSESILHVPGGFGQQALMEDTEVLGRMEQQGAGAFSVFSVLAGRDGATYGRQTRHPHSDSVGGE